MYNFYESYYYFLYEIFPPAMFIFGIAGNLVVIQVFSRRSFVRNTAKNYFCALAAVDALNSVIIIIYHPQAFQSYFICLSQFTCKLADFMAYFLPASTSWLLVMIGIDRLALIRYRSIKVFEKKIFQISMICAILLWNFFVYVERTKFSYLDIQSPNSSNETCNTNNACDIFSTDAGEISSWVDLVNSTITPFIIMITCSFLIIHSIYIARRKIQINKSKSAMARFKKDIQFSMTIVLLDILFFIFNFPICVYSFFGFENDFVYSSLDLLFSCQHITNILIYVFLNSEFKKEFVIMLRLKSHNQSRLHNSATAITKH